MRTVDIKELRERLHLSQKQFAERFGINLATVQQWEQGRRYPDGPSRVLLAVISDAPEVVESAVGR